MKKTLFIVAFASVITVVNAQKPVAGDKGVTVGFTSVTGTVSSASSNSGSVIFKYLFKDDMTFRLGLNIGELPGNGTVVSDTNTMAAFNPGPSFGNGYSQTTTKSTGMSWTVNLGVQKSMGSSTKLDPFIGADVFFGSVAGQGVDMKEEWLKDGGGRVTGDYDQEVTTGASTFTWGVEGIIGLNWFFAENLALGAELGYGYSSSTTKGGESKTESKAGSTVTTTTATASDDAKISTGGLGTTGGTLTLSWFFN